MRVGEFEADFIVRRLKVNEWERFGCTYEFLFSISICQCPYWLVPYIIAEYISRRSEICDPVEQYL